MSEVLHCLIPAALVGPWPFLALFDVVHRFCVEHGNYLILEGQILSEIHLGCCIKILLCVLSIFFFYGRFGMFDFLLFSHRQFGVPGIVLRCRAPGISPG